LFAPFADGRLGGKVDLVVCNPPYISSAKVKGLPTEISGFEPHLAFDGGSFGMDILGRLIKEAPLHLQAGSWLGFEVGLGQGGYLARCLRRMGPYTRVEECADPSGEVRALLANT